MNINIKNQEIKKLSYAEKIMLARKTNNINILEILFKDNNLNIKTAILFNPNTPIEVFEKIITNKYYNDTYDNDTTMIKTSDWDTSNVADMSYMFANPNMYKNASFCKN